MIALAKLSVMLGADALCSMILSLRPGRSLAAENLFLRSQPALSKERGIKPGPVHLAPRVSPALLATLFDWRDALIVVRTETLIRWHCAGFRLFWRHNSGTGRPPIPAELRAPIRGMTTENQRRRCMFAFGRQQSFETFPQGT